MYPLDSFSVRKHREERNENVMISTITRLHFASKTMYPNPIESSLFKYVRGKTDEYLIRKNENMT